MAEALRRFRVRNTLGSSRIVIGSSGGGGDVAWVKVPSTSCSVLPSAPAVEAMTVNGRVASRPGSGG